jgi:hypothetical protein
MTHHHDHKGDIDDIQDAQQLEISTDTAVAQHHPELVEHPEKVAFRTWLAVFFLGLIYSCVTGCKLIPLNVISVINADLGPDTSSTWIASGYTIALGIGSLIANSISE